MTNIFRGHTHQPTALQQAIEQATDGNQTTEDWGMIMKICDHVSSHEERFFLLHLLVCLSFTNVFFS